MFAKNCLTLVGAVAALHGVAAQLDIDSARAAGLFPSTFAERLKVCDTGKISLDSDRPCDLEKAEDARLLQEAGLDPAKEVDRNDAQKVSAYRKGVEASVFRTNAQNCCFDCKKIHEIHNEAQDQYWRAFYAKNKIEDWYSAVDAWAAGKTKEPVPLLWAYLQSRSGGDAPSSNLATQALNVTEQKLDSYCPALRESKNAAVTTISASSSVSVTFPGPCMNFFVKAEAKALIQSAKFPANMTVTAKSEVSADLFVTCPLNHVEGNSGNTAYSPPRQVQGASVKVDVKADAKADVNIISREECSACRTDSALTHVVAISENFDQTFTKGAPADLIKNVEAPQAGSVQIFNNVDFVASASASVRISGGVAPALTPANKGQDAASTSNVAEEDISC